jgi:hypothetical protein
MATFQKHKEILKQSGEKIRTEAKRVSYEHVMEGMKNLQGILRSQKWKPVTREVMDIDRRRL